uniref:Uncharacterized protein n=1 Tax=Salix viminalis TaxID=40686 RepID=A0A6N2NAJ8_SALVM
MSFLNETATQTGNAWSMIVSYDVFARSLSPWCQVLKWEGGRRNEEGDEMAMGLVLQTWSR